MEATTGRVVAVSGGAGGAGMAVVRVFAEQGDHVIVLERAETRDRVVNAELSHVTFLATDVFDESSVADAVEQIITAWNRLDVLVNVVGGYAAGQPIHELETATWEQMLQVNLRPAFLLAKYAARPMIARKWGRIIHFAARAGRDTAANAGGYAVAKAAVLALMEVQAKELVQEGVTTNAILPSIIDTPANRAAMPDADFARWPKPEEVARVVRFLASEEAGLISGASIPVYGRW